MDRKPVDSKTMVDVGYDSASQILEIGFTNGTVYQYSNFGEHLYEMFMASMSKGAFFNANIRNRFPTEKV